LGWNVHREKKTLQRNINDWAAVPYRDRKIWLNELETSFTKNRDTVLQELKSPIQQRSKNEVRFVPEEIIICVHETFNDET